jgi:hypothetical protein
MTSRRIRQMLVSNIPTLSPMHPGNACPIWMRITAIRPALIHTSGGDSAKPIVQVMKYKTRAVILLFAGVETEFESAKALAAHLGCDVSTVGHRIRSGRRFRCGGTARYAERQTGKK